MNASKENARKAKRMLWELHDSGPIVAGEMPKDFVTRFIEACERKLPTEAAYKRDRERRKK